MKTSDILRAKKSKNKEEILAYAKEFACEISRELQSMYRVEFAAGDVMSLRVRYMTDVIQKALNLKEEQNDEARYAAQSCMC